MMQFIFVEGPDGSGKSTAVQAIATAAESVGRTVHTARFPSDEWMASRSHDKSAGSFLTDIVRGMLSFYREGSDDVVVCDRGFLSTMAYQHIKWRDVRQYLPPVLLEQRMSIIRLSWPVSRLIENMKSRGDCKVGFNTPGDTDEALKDALRSLESSYARAYDNLFDMWLTNPNYQLFTLRPATRETWETVTESVQSFTKKILE